MKIRDIVNHLTKLLHEKTNKKVYVEQIGDLIEDCLYVELISADRETRSFNIEKLTVKLDVKYYHSKDYQSNLEIQDVLDVINLAFDRTGIKVLNVFDRFITLQNTNQTIVDGVGHYIFDIELLVDYGTKPTYSLMQILEIEYK